MKALTDDLPNWKTGRLQAAQTPAEQFDEILLKWTAGKDIKYDKWMKDLTPAQDEVWEMKTADLRIFGWLYKPLTFIAAFLDYADDYKGVNPKMDYEVTKGEVIAVRNALDLDPPKFATGTFDALVRV